MKGGTFQIARKDQPKREHPYVDSFDFAGETFVIHARIDGIGYTASHKATGWRVPKTEAMRTEEVKHKALAVLEANAGRLAEKLAGVK